MKNWLLLLFVTTTLHANWEDYKQKVMLKQKDIPGWCCFEKADKLMNLIRETEPAIVVEIGVFGGSSVYPMAQALRYNKKGVIHAIDPWMAVDCQIGYTPDDVNYQWWTNVDLDKIYRDFVKLIKTSHLNKYCHIMRTTAKEALSNFDDESIDILHIDGNHSEENALSDVQMYLPKVKHGGYIWFDDANWMSTNRATQALKEECTLDIQRSIGNDCLLFQKP